MTAIVVAISCGAILVTVIAIFKQSRVIEGHEAQLKTLLAQKKRIDVKSLKYAAPTVLDHDNWAEFEGTLPHLVQVVILADVVEQPQNGLLRAVLANFQRGVQYCFIVSSSKADKELEGFFAIFEGYARAAITKFGLHKSVTDLVTILRLPDDWENVPYVFYRFRDGPSELGCIRTIAFRGDIDRAGIADRYIAVDQDSAEALHKLLLGKPPECIEKVVPLWANDKISDAGTIVRGAGGDESIAN